LSELHSSLLYNFLSPVRSLQSWFDLRQLRRYAGEYADMHGDIHRFDAAREVHERLSEYLGNKRTMGEEGVIGIPEEDKEGEDLQPLNEDGEEEEKLIVEDPPVERPPR